MTTLASERTTFAVNDLVTLNHPRYAGQVFVVDRVKQTKCIIKRQDMTGDRGLDAPMSMMVKYDSTTPPPPVRPTLTSMPALTMGVGEVVRLLRPFRRNTTETLMVVTKINQTTVSLDLLGGPTKGTPMRIGVSGVTKVDLADILR